jgi:hypothetical protein
MLSILGRNGSLPYPTIMNLYLLYVNAYLQFFVVLLIIGILWGFDKVFRYYSRLYWMIMYIP